MAHSFLSSQNMLSLYIVAIAVVSLATVVHTRLPSTTVHPDGCGTYNDLTQRYLYLKWVNKRRSDLAAGRQQNGKSGETLPRGDIAPLKWDCELERKAIDSLNSDGCKKEPNVPSGMTGFFDYVHIDDDGLSGMEMWLSEIDDTSMDASVKNGAVQYHNKNENYSNLVRHDATRIGCAKKFCSTRIKCGKKSKKSCSVKGYSIFCLTNKSPLKAGETIYQIRT